MKTGGKLTLTRSFIQTEWKCQTASEGDGEGVDTANDNADMPAACHPWLSHRCNLFDTEQSLV